MIRVCAALVNLCPHTIYLLIEVKYFTTCFHQETETHSFENLVVKSENLLMVTTGQQHVV